MTIYQQPEKVQFGSFRYQNGSLYATLSHDDSQDKDSIDDQIANSELFNYLDENNLTFITFKSKSTDQYSFVCKITKVSIILKLQSSIKILLYNYNVNNNELFLNKRKVDKSFYAGFLQKLQIIAKKAMLAQVEMIQQ